MKLSNDQMIELKKTRDFFEMLDSLFFLSLICVFIALFVCILEFSGYAIVAAVIMAGVCLMISLTRKVKINRLEKTRYLANFGEFVRDHYSNSAFLKIMVLRSHDKLIKSWGDEYSYKRAINMLYNKAETVQNKKLDVELHNKYEKYYGKTEC